MDTQAAAIESGYQDARYALEDCECEVHETIEAINYLQSPSKASNTTSNSTSFSTMGGRTVIDARTLSHVQTLQNKVYIGNQPHYILYILCIRILCLHYYIIQHHPFVYAIHAQTIITYMLMYILYRCHRLNSLVDRHQDKTIKNRVKNPHLRTLLVLLIRVVCHN